MKCFKLLRLEDESGVSGTGIVAEGVRFGNGMVALSWVAGEVNSVTIYHSIDEVEKIHGHQGKTRVELCTEIG